MDLVEKLIEKNFLDEEKALSLKEEMDASGKSIEELLLEKKIISEEDLFSIKSELTGMPLKIDINLEDVPKETFRFFHEDSVNHYKMIPVGKEEETIEIGMVYPENLRAREALKFITRKENISYKPYLIPLSVFQKVKEKYAKTPKEDTSHLIKKLVEKEVFSKEEGVTIEKEARERKKTVEEILLEKEKISEEDLFLLKSEISGFPFKEDVQLENISLDLADLIHEETANQYKMVPVGKEGEVVEIGMVYPENIRAQEALKFISRQDIFSYKVFLISLSTFKKVWEKYHAVSEDFGDVLLEKLIEKGFLEKERAEEVKEKANKEDKTKEDVLVKEEVVSEKELFSIKGEIAGIAFRDKVDGENIPSDILKIFPREAVEHYKMAPIGKEGETIEIGMVYPENSRAKEALKLIAEQEGFQYEMYLISFSDLEKVSKKIKTLVEELGSTLAERLVEEGFLNKEKAREIEERAEKEKKTKEELIIEEDVISEEELFTFKSNIVSVPFKSNIDVERIPDDVLRLIPEDSANYYKMAPIGKEEETIEIGMVYPENLRAREALKFLSRRSGFSYTISLLSLSTFEAITKQYRTLTKEVGEALEDIEEMETDEIDTKLDMDKDVSRLAEEAPIVKVVAVILRNAIEGGASDIHIEPTREKLKVRFRVDGTLYSSLYLPMGIHLATIARIKILAGLKIDEQRLPQDGRFSMKMRDKNIDFRVSTFPTTLGEKVVIRVLDPEKGLKSIDGLGVIGRNFEILKESIKKPTGLTLVTGPTGSGKTTTLYAIMQILNKEGVNIVTLEDPVEYFIDGINQSQTHSDIGYVFSKGLRQILRQDPDIIMVGEIRDEETADLAIHASLTGHIVLSTLHTNNAVGVVPRLIDMGVKPFLLPSALNTTMSQRLVGKLCDKCKKQVTPKESVKKLIDEELKSIPPHILKKLNIPSPLKIYVSQGCKYCSGEGLEGRTGIFEVLKMTPELGEIIMGNPNEKQLKEEAMRQGMLTLKQDGILKVLQGQTTIEEVLRATEEK